MKRGAIVVAVVIALVLVPMWYVAIQGEAPAEEIEIDQSISDIRPLQSIVDTPNKLSPSQVGVIVWVALFALVGVLTAAHRFMNDAVRPSDPDRTAADGGASPWFTSGGRWIVAYHDPAVSIEGIVAMGALTVLSITFAALFTGEYLTLARTQYFGVYAAGMFLSLAALTAAYYAWFLPHVEVAERRGHGP